MTHEYFTERLSGPIPRSKDIIPTSVYRAIADAVEQRIEDGAMGFGFPDFCTDGAGCCGCDRAAFKNGLEAELPGMLWPWDMDNPPATDQLMDCLEFIALNVGEPNKRGFHSYMNHHHLDHDREAGLAGWRDRLNQLFRRNGISYVMNDQGLMTRLAPELIRDALQRPRLPTGDTELDRLIEDARQKYLAPKLDVRREAVECLWDAFERVKTLLDPDKRAGVKALLDLAARAPGMRTVLETDAKALTEIGNQLQIRHYETNQEKIVSSEEVDYVFHRMFALLQLLVRSLPINSGST
ncbi:hypothetical protein [Devosia lacusdianchii]|uniref:hypothetical protein n=1 Tax=Devosia lacusdianchii TaxID=2917991 RepID=UPI001F052AA1|nr:hypothetical protein [Devosia sp. JXJ CY 41]